MSKFAKFLKYLILSVYAVCGLALLVFAMPRTGWKALTVVTGSMRPSIPPGSLVVVHRVPNASLKVGDVITYINPKNPKQTITHRIVVVTHNGNLPAYVTKGDANNTNDQQILGGNVVGRVVWHVPTAGRVVGWTKRPLGLVLLLGLPALIIIIDEIRILARSLSKKNEKGESAKLAPPAPRPAPTPLVAAKKPAPKPKRSMSDIVSRLLILGLFGTLAIHGTQAQLVSNSATLTNNTIKTLVPVGHVVINRVLIGGGSLVCPTVPNTVTIENTGAGSQNQVVAHSGCTITTTNNNNVNVTNNNNQTSSSGSASGNNSSTGNASNNNSTTTVINISNSTATNVQWVELYNPTAATVGLGNWSLTDNSGLPRFLAGTIPAHGFVLISGVIGDGLNGAGDRLILKNSALASIDAASWGNDTSQLNPAITAIAAGTGIHRKALGLDADSATDWAVGF